MKKIRFILITCLSVLLTTISFAGQWKTLETIKGGKKKIVIVGGNEWIYYRIDPGKSMEFELVNPVEHRIITRAEFEGNKKKEAVYTFRLNWGGKIDRLVSRATERTRTIHEKGKEERLGVGKTFEFFQEDVPQVLTISIDTDATRSVYFRVQQKRPEFADIVDYIAIHPSQYVERMEVNTRDLLSNYYCIDPEQKLRVDLFGPTVLKVHARLAVERSSNKKHIRTISVYEDGIHQDNYELLLEASSVSTFTTSNDSIPTSAETIYIEVPKGNHRYQFSLLEGDTDRVGLRFFLPEKDLTVGDNSN